MTDAIGLREQKRLATRHALQVALLEQALERGFDAVTVEEVAAAAQVSPRTFFNYFASKEDAISGEHAPFDVPDDEVRRFLDGDGDVLADLVELLARCVREDDAIDVARLRKRLMQQEPQLLGLRMARVQRFHEAAAAFVAERVRTDRARRGLPADEVATHDDAGLLVMVGVAIARHGWSRWVSSGGVGSLGDSMRAGYAEFRLLTGPRTG